MMKGIRPRVIIPIHWDNFFLPIPGFAINTPGSLKPFPLHKLRMTRFKKIVQRIDPEGPPALPGI
jgi:L-ascorbate metabolism protein UlaG (beta-lactamase superfamily)